MKKKDENDGNEKRKVCKRAQVLCLEMSSVMRFTT